MKNPNVNTLFLFRKKNGFFSKAFFFKERFLVVLVYIGIFKKK